MDDELITVTVDRPIGSSHPDYPSLVYPVNYGYIEGVLTPGGEEQDAYIIGVDIPVDKFTGRKIAIIHRKDDVGDKWVVAPENMPYTKQQIEEMVYFQEQYYDSFVQMLNEEMWDACDAWENKLGYKVPRSMAKSLADGVFHVVVMIYTVTTDGRVLVTQRSQNKTNPLKWEVTGGSILAGETPQEGAVRELSEETGITAQTSDLVQLYEYADYRRHSIYHSYVYVTQPDTKVTLQEGETMNYRWLSYKEFVELVESDRFVPSEQERFCTNRANIEKKLMSIKEFKEMSDI